MDSLTLPVMHSSDYIAIFYTSHDCVSLSWPLNISQEFSRSILAVYVIRCYAAALVDAAAIHVFPATVSWDDVDNSYTKRKRIGGQLSQPKTFRITCFSWSISAPRGLASPCTQPPKKLIGQLDTYVILGAFWSFMKFRASLVLSVDGVQYYQY